MTLLPVESEAATQPAKSYEETYQKRYFSHTIRIEEPASFSAKKPDKTDAQKHFGIGFVTPLGGTAAD